MDSLLLFLLITLAVKVGTCDWLWTFLWVKRRLVRAVTVLREDTPDE